jgi:hypothetical protein
MAAKPPADALALFANANPNSVFSHLEEIGHGNFGAVYQVRTPCFTPPTTLCIVPHRFLGLRLTCTRE